MSRHPESVVLLFSGGPDSTTLLYDLVAQGKHVHALTFNFGEAEGWQEREHARAVISQLTGSVEHHIYDFSAPLREFYGLPTPQFLRKVVDFETDLEVANYVQPFGSSIALLLSASWAIKHGIRDVYYGVHHGDSIYHDNTSTYFAALSKLTAICEGDAYTINFHVPYLQLAKSEVVARGVQLGVPFAITWSCAVGDTNPCGQCDPCRDRQAAFQLAGIPSTADAMS